MKSFIQTKRTAYGQAFRNFGLEIMNFCFPITRSKFVKWLHDLPLETVQEVIEEIIEKKIETF